jgi:hypothetical protein
VRPALIFGDPGARHADATTSRQDSNLDERDRRSVARQLRVDEEAPVGGDVVVPPYRSPATADDARGKERRWCPRLKCVPHRSDRHRHHLACRIDVIQLLAVRSPHGKEATRGGDLPLAPCHPCGRVRRIRRDKWPHVDLRPSRLVRLLVGHPAAVRRERADRFSQGSLRNTDGARSPRIGTTQRSVPVRWSTL